MNKTASAGNTGGRIRSDCFVTLELTTEGGINIILNSKVKALYGEDIQNLCKEVLKYFDIENANLSVEDSGALPFVLAARLEAAIKQVIDTEKEYLPELIAENCYFTKKEQYRFSRLYLPGNSPSMMINAGIHQPNGIILDLEDSVAPAKKHEARFLVRNALRALNFYGDERMVRINQGKTGIDELKYLVPHYINLILIPKCETAEYITLIDKEIDRLRKIFNVEYPIFYMPIIESAMGVENAFAIAKASPNVVSLAIGLEDFTADLGVKRTKEGKESLYARMRLVNACKAAGIQAIDSVFSDVADSEGLIENVKTSKSLGFEGMGCIHPRQIRIIHEYYAPDAEEIDKAKKIVFAFNEAEKLGLGVVALGSKMIDPPVVKRALKSIELAVNLGLLPNNWQETVVA